MQSRHSAPLVLILGFALQQSGIAQSGPNVSFAVGSRPAGGEPRAVVAADFNIDGHPDFATANLTLDGGGGSGVAVFYSTGNGTFAPPVVTPTAAGAFDLATADFNRDGRPDLAVSNADADSVTVLLGTETGLIYHSTFGSSGSPRGIVAGDFTRDGHVDLAVIGDRCGCVDVARGNGLGMFVPFNAFGVGPHPEDIVTADFNRDGTLDLYVGNVGNSTGAVLFGAGEGTFTRVRIDPLGFRPRGLDTADFDGDGRVDVAVVGDRSFHVSRDIPSASYYGGPYGTGTQSDARDVVAFDVNSDGWADAAVASRGGGGVHVLVNMRGGTGAIGFHSPVGFPTGAGARAVASADFDRDGRSDLVVGNQSARTVTLLLNTTARADPTPGGRY